MRFDRSKGVSAALAAGAALALVLASGPPLHAGSDSAAQDDATRGALTSAGSFYVEWTPDPHPIILNKIFTIHVRVLDVEDRKTPIQGAVITAHALMPEHNHGSRLEPRIEVHGDGTATGEGFLLHMEGRWELGIGVAVTGRMERATFEIDVLP